MPIVTFVEHDGTRHEVEAEAGATLMRAAVDSNVPGIDADCGGECACATCHVFIDDDWRSHTGTTGDEEARLLGFAAARKDGSRLSCQIEITTAMNGLIVHLPEAQH